MEPLPDSPPVAGPRGTSATDGPHGLYVLVGASDVVVEPGAAADINVFVRNKGSVVEQATIGVAGVPPEWISIEPLQVLPEAWLGKDVDLHGARWVDDCVNLLVDATAGAVVRIHLPRSPRTRPGRVPVQVAVWATTNPNVRCAETIFVTVAAYDDPSTRLEPVGSQGRRSGHHRLVVANGGNATLVAAVKASDADGQLRLSCDPSEVTVAPGTETTVGVTALAKKRFLFGAPTTHRFDVAVTATGRASSTQAGTFTQHALLPHWTRRAAVVGFAVAAALAGLGIWHVVAQRPRSVPDTVGMTLTEARRVLAKSGFDQPPKLTFVENDKPKDQVLDQRPRPRSRHKPGAAILLEVSTGFRLPDVRGTAGAEAKSTLESHGVRVTLGAERPDPVLRKGLVISQEPAPGTVMAQGAIVTLVVSSGIPSVRVPSVIHLYRAEAFQLITNQKLLPQFLTTVDEANVDQVVKQEPAAGTLVPEGSTVDVILGAHAPSPSPAATR